MKTLEQFKEYFERSIKPDIEPLEKERLKAKKKVIVALIVMIIIPVIILVLMAGALNRVKLDSQLIVVYVAICGGILFWLQKSFVSNFKDKVIQKIINYIEPGLKYEKSSYIPEVHFNSCKIFDTNPNIYHGDDYVSGTVLDNEWYEKTGESKGTSIEFSEIEAKYESGSGKNRTVRTIFKGMFFIADYNKKFNGYTKVLPDYKKNWLFGTKDRIKLEDPEFEKYFEVYGSDQIEARYIITPSLMQRLLNFKKKTGRPVYAAFKDDKIYVCIEYIRNLFEPNVFRTLYDFEPMQQYFEDLQFAIGIVEELNLNTRVWSKE